MDRVGKILVMPMTTVVRLIGCAIEATGGHRAPGNVGPSSDDMEILKMLDEKARAAGVKK